MKKANFLFLFFCCLTTALHAQIQADSSSYYHNIIVRPEQSSDINAAFTYFNREVDKNLHQGDILSAVNNLRRIAMGQFELGFYYDSEETAVRALALLEEIPYGKRIVEPKRGLVNHLGLVYRKLKFHQKALDYFADALQLASGTKDSLIIINNISNIYLDRQDYPKALQSYKLSYSKSLKLQDSASISMAMNNLGFVQSKLDMPEGLPNILKAQEIRERQQDIPGIYSSNIHLANHYIDRNRQGEARQYAQQAVEVARNMNSPAHIQNALGVLLQTSDHLELSEYKRLTDSITQARQGRENKYAGIKYDVDREKRRAQAAELESERGKRQKSYYLFALILTGLSLGFIVYYKNQKQKREKIRIVQQTESRLSKKIHDELSNDVYKAMAQLQHENTASPVIDNLQDIYVRTRNISRENSPVDTGSNYGEGLSAMLGSYMPEQVKLVLRGLQQVNWSTYSDEKKIALYRVLQELMTNMNKHSKATLVAITFDEGPAHLRVGYVDNGHGSKRDPLSLRGGLQNAENRISSVKGNLTFDTTNGKGFSSEIRIPK